MLMLKRFTAACLVLAAVLLSVAPSFAQGLGGGPTPFTIGTTDLKFRRTLAATATTPYSGQGAGRFINSSGVVVGSFIDSTFLFRNPVAGNMSFDTTETFTLSDLKDWVPVHTANNVALAVDSLWMWTLHVLPVNDGYTTALGAGTTGGGVTISADTLNFYFEVSSDGGQNWSRPRTGVPVSYLKAVTSPTTVATAMPFFRVPFCSTQPIITSPTISPVAWFVPGDVYRFVIVNDFAGKFRVQLSYPKGIR